MTDQNISPEPLMNEQIEDESIQKSHMTTDSSLSQIDITAENNSNENLFNQSEKQEDEGNNDEDIRLGSRKPLATLIILSIGPIISQIFSSLFGVFNSLWITKTIGSQGLEVFGAIFIVDFIQIGFAQYLMISINIRISYLYGLKAKEKCGQLYVDFLRLAIVFGALTAAIILPITKPLTKWLGASERLSNLCIQYMIPASSLSCLTYLYTIGCGVLQAEGRPFLFCLAQICTFILNICIFDPIILWLFKPHIWGCTLATAFSQFIVGSVLHFFIFRGKFALRPTSKMFCSKFSSETGQALLVGIPELVMELSLSVPLIMAQKYIDKASKARHIYDECTQAWGLTQRLYTFVEAMELGFVFGYLPAASYAFGASRYRRVLKLTLHLVWIITLLSSIFAYTIVIFVKPISAIWNSDEAFLDAAVRMVPVIFYAMPLVGLAYMAPALLEAMQKATTATLLSILSLLVTPMAVASILHFTRKDDPFRVMLMYPISDCITAVYYILFTLKPFITLYRSPLSEYEVEQEEQWKKEKEAKQKEALTNKLNKMKAKNNENIDDEKVSPNNLIQDTEVL